MTERLRVPLISRADLVGTDPRTLEETASRGVDRMGVVPPRWRDPGRAQHLERVHVQGYEPAVEPLMANGSFHLQLSGARRVVSYSGGPVETGSSLRSAS